MSAAAAPRTRRDPAARRQPNELDLRRVERTISERRRYRYVRPSVIPVDNGYLIRSACCSRNIDPEGGEIDIALFRWEQERGEWSLMSKDHATGNWVEDSRYARLPDLLLRINADPFRSFWQ